MIRGERKNDNKIKTETSAHYCSVFNSSEGPGVIYVSDVVRVYSLPWLELVSAVEDSSECNPARLYRSDTERSICSSQDGQTFVCSSSNEIRRFGCLKNAQNPRGPEKLIDQSRIIRPAAKSVGDGNASKQKNHIVGLLNNVKDVATSTISQLSESAKLGCEPPSLHHVFRKEVNPLTEDIEIDSISDDDDGGGGGEKQRMTVASLQKEVAHVIQNKVKSFGKNRTIEQCSQKSDSFDSPSSSTVKRHELFGTTQRKAGSGACKLPARTTSEIKRVYGHTRATDARVTMERNRELLAERGRKLANLEAQSAAMQGDAEDFASMAKELQKAFADRKWWQF